MATFSSVTRDHILQAIAEYDARGGDDFLGVYGFAPPAGYWLRHEGRSYDSRAILGVAHRYATGRLAPAEEFGGGMAGPVAVLRRRGFEVVEPASATTARRPAAAPRSPSPTPARRAPARRSASADDAPAICPTCSMALPATGVCDSCG